MKIFSLLVVILISGCASMVDLAPDSPQELRGKGGSKSVSFTGDFEKSFNRAHDYASKCYGYKPINHGNMSTQLQFNIYKVINEENTMASFYMVQEGHLLFKDNTVSNVTLVADFVKEKSTNKVRLYYVEPIGNAWEGVADKIIDWASGKSDEC